MQSLTVVGRENDQLIVVNESGERFTITIDQALIDQVRKPKSSARPSRHQVSPKDIQAHIRRGLTAQQVADLTGEDLAYVQRFEGPVLAERDFIVEQARQMSISGDRPENAESFGDLVGAKLDDLRASDVTWSAWKEETGWRVEVTFTEGDVEHRAQWNFDQRKHTLTPLNDDAAVLSQKEPIRGPLIPKLRAVPTAESPDEQRFDSEIFENMSLDQTGPLLEPVPYGRSTVDVPDDENDVPVANTADLLEVLRRRRGEREPAPDYDQEASRNAHPSTGSIRLVNPDDESDTTASVHPLRQLDDEDDSVDEETPEPKPSSRKNRPEMPSWDDIVFGTKSDDDPA